MHPQIVLFGAGRSATCLIDYLLTEAAVHHWKLTVADGDQTLAQSKIGGSPFGRAQGLDIRHEESRQQLVSGADLVISLLPPSLHALLARDCLSFGKNLLTASYVDEDMARLRPEIESKNLLFLCEMGLDPGIDHMSAMQLVDRIHRDGGKVIRFLSHTGGLVAPSSDDNPWHYKVSWNPGNIVRAGSGGAVFREEGQRKTWDYQELFGRFREVSLPSLGRWAWYPNRDSLRYLELYGLDEAQTFIRTTLRHPIFCQAWQAIVAAGLTSALPLSDVHPRTYAQWSKPIRPRITEGIQPLLAFLGLFDEREFPAEQTSSAAILQGLVESRLAMQPRDRDMIVMLHQLVCQMPSSRDKSVVQVESFLRVEGQDRLRTAMAQTVGLPLGIAAKMVLTRAWDLHGLLIPTLPAIYEPVLRELAPLGIRFEERVS